MATNVPLDAILRGLTEEPMTRAAFYTADGPPPIADLASRIRTIEVQRFATTFPLDGGLLMALQPYGPMFVAKAEKEIRARGQRMVRKPRWVIRMEADVIPTTDAEQYGIHELAPDVWRVQVADPPAPVPGPEEAAARVRAVIEMLMQNDTGSARHADSGPEPPVARGEEERCPGWTDTTMFGRVRCDLVRGHPRPKCSYKGEGFYPEIPENVWPPYTLEGDE